MTVDDKDVDIMVIHDRSGEVILDIDVDDDSYRYRAIMNGTQVVLYYSLTEHVEVPVGAYIEYQGVRYTLWRPENFKKHGPRNLEYTVEFRGDEEALKKYIVKDLSISPHKLIFSYTATPRQLLQLYVDNLNLRESGWKVGKCIEGVEKLYSFNNEFIFDALNRTSGDLKTEYNITNKTIDLCKVEINKDAPLELSYGKGNGFKPGTGRANVGEKQPIVILNVQGGTRNIDASKYGSTTLLLPKNQEVEYEGRKYRTSEDGTYLYRSDIAVRTGQESGYDGSHIYPSRVGTISNVIVVDAEKKIYDIIDTSIPEALDYSKYRIAGQRATIKFESGRLAGQGEFDLEQTDEALTGYIHPERRFKIVPKEKDGQVMPNETFRPSVNDKYAIFGIALPDAYICDNTSKSGASWDMLWEAVRYKYENEDEQYSFTGELQGSWAKKRWLEIGGKILPGGYVLFSDTQYQPEGVLIRITGVRDYINKPHSPEIELSNISVGASKSSELGKIDADEVINEERHHDALSFTERRYRDAVETMKMLEKAFLNFSKSIDPIAVRTMQLLVGDESLQFRFVSGKTNPTTVAHNVTYNKSTKILTAPAGILQHMTLGIKDISSSHKANEYKFWDMELYNSPPLVEPDKSYYLYAKVSKTSSKGVFRLSEDAIKIEGEAGYYHLLVGVLNSEYESARSFVELYGFVEILPGRITADRMISTDGNNFIDFINNAVRIGNASTYIDFNTKGDGKLRIKGTIVQSESGAESFIGCFRGIFNSGYTYYSGDEVTYNNGAYVSTYRYKYPTPSKGILPTNTEYWEVVAQGGLGIKDTDVLYVISNSNTVAPSTGWQTDAPAWKDGTYIWSKTQVTYTDGSIKYTDAACITGGKGETGNGISSIVEQYYLSSSATSLSGGSWTTSRPTWRDGWYIWTRSVITYTAGNQVTTSAICVTGGKGETGEDGGYFEYRYAVNGSRTSWPTLSKTSIYPAGWTTEMPAVGALQYLWCTVAKKNAAGSLLTYWSTPTRITGYDGKDGEVGPALAYQGVYSSGKNYYGTSKRVDAVKYNNIYYVARVDAGNGFSGKLPTDTNYWNEFGNQFESVATNLLLAENAAIGSWFHSGGKIVSTLSDGNKITLDASAAQIIIESSLSGGIYSQDKSQGAIIKLDATNGLIEARSKSNGRVAYMSPTGIFCNNAETLTESAALGVIHKAAVVGLGYGTVNKAEWNNDNFLAGVYGTARNSGTAPAFGGFFQNLMAAGLFLKMRAIEDKYNSKGELITGYKYINKTDSLVIGYSRNEQVAYLPNDGVIGRIIIFKQWWTGNMKVFTRGGQVIYDDHTANSYFRVTEGRLVFAIFTIGYIDNVRKEAWLVNTVRDFIED